MEDQNLENKLREARRLMFIQFAVMNLLIISGAVYHGFITQQWSKTVELALILMTILTLSAPIIYCRVKHLVTAFSEVRMDD